MARVKKLSPKDVNEAFEALRKEIVTGDDEHMLGYLANIATFAANARRVHGMFRRWSHRNHLLLESQRHRLNESHKGVYAGTAQWSKLDRVVRSDASPKTIWAFSGRKPAMTPATVPPTPTPATTVIGPASISSTAQVPTTVPTVTTIVSPVASVASVAPLATSHHAGGMGFMRVTVFDWTDTVSTNGDFVEPTWAAPLASGDRDVLADLVGASPVRVRFEDLGARNENGWLTSSGITVDSSMPLGNQISTLAHELVHHFANHRSRQAAASAKIVKGEAMSERELVHARCEQEASLGQWLVMKMLGLDEQIGNEVGAAAATYLRSWVDPETAEEINGHKRRLKLLNERLDVAMAAATQVVDAFLVASGDSTSAPAALSPATDASSV